MRRVSIARRCAKASALTLLLIGAAQIAPATDIYGPQPAELQIPTLGFGSATLADVVLTVNLPPLSGPMGFYPVGTEDTYVGATNQLNVPAVSVGSARYYNARTTVNQLTSIASVQGADTFDGTNLLIRNVQVGGAAEYHDVTLHVSAADVVRIGGGLPGYREDRYDPAAGQLTIAAVQVGEVVYTNVLLHVAAAQIASVAGYVENAVFKFQNDSLGASPWGGLVLDAAGNLYGTTEYGGSAGGGTVFELAPNGSGGYTRTVLYSFKAGKDGANPLSGVIVDASGNLYGTTVNWGTGTYGTVFKLTLNGGGYTESVLHSFLSNADGNAPNAGLVIDPGGNLYGTTKFGGNTITKGYGTVFRLAPNGSGGYTETILYAFQNEPDGAYPLSALILDANGALFGTTSGGAGSAANGVVFKLTPSGGGSYSYGVLYAFRGGADGAEPQAGLVMDPYGNLFGTTLGGGAAEGTVYELLPGGGGYNENVLYRFQGSTDGAQPAAAVLADAGGALYGTTLFGGSDNLGTVFKLSPGSGGYSKITLHSFASSPDGTASHAALLMDPGGNLYGTTYNGGYNSNGIVFQIH